jgi:hypothetical protein
VEVLFKRVEKHQNSCHVALWRLSLATNQRSVPRLICLLFLFAFLPAQYNTYGGVALYVEMFVEKRKMYTFYHYHEMISILPFPQRSLVSTRLYSNQLILWEGVFCRRRILGSEQRCYGRKWSCIIRNVKIKRESSHFD